MGADDLCEPPDDPEAWDHPQPSPLLSSLSTPPWDSSFVLKNSIKGIHFHLFFILVLFLVFVVRNCSCIVV